MISVEKILIIVSVLFFSTKIYSQNTFDQKASQEIDSLIKKDNYDLVHFKLDNENISFKRLSKYPLRYDLLIKLDSASVLYRKGKYLESKNAVLLTMNEIQGNKNKLDLSHYESLKHTAISRLFYIEKRLGNIPQGLKYLNTFSRDMSPKYEKKNRIYFAIAYIELGNYKKGIDMLNLRLNDILTDTDSNLYSKTLKGQEVASTYNTKGDTFIKWYKDTGTEKFLDSAQHNYDKAYLIVKKPSTFSPYSKPLLLDRYANIALLKKQYKRSLSLYNQCEKDSILMGKNFSRESVWMGKAEIYTFLKKTDSAFYYIDKLYNKKTSEKCTYENKLKIYHLLSLNYENLGDSKNAYKFAKLSLSEMNKKKLQDTSGNAFLGMHEQQEIRSMSEKMIKENKERTFLLIILVVLTSCVITLYIIYRFNKRKRKLFLDVQKKLNEAESFNIYPSVTEKTESPIIIEDELVNRILKKMDSMEANKKFLSNNFKLANVAKQLNTNTAYLSQIINQHKGMSFSEYVNNLRINYVLKELQDNSVFRKYTLQTISEEIGYKSPTTFINAFKSRVKMTPSSYIQQLEKDNSQKNNNNL
jgi:AraC-like DNA-binding protein